MDQESDNQSIYNTATVSALLELYLESSGLLSSIMISLKNFGADSISGQPMLRPLRRRKHRFTRGCLHIEISETWYLSCWLWSKETRDKVLHLLAPGLYALPSVLAGSTDVALALDPNHLVNIPKPDSERVAPGEPSLLLGLNAVEAALSRLHSLAIATRRSAVRSHQQKLSLNALRKDEGLCYIQFVK
jgi:hypothetical protein